MVMNVFQIGTILGIKLVRAIAMVLSVSLLVSSSYVFWDMWHTEKSAFSSADMSQYRPMVENGEPATLEEAEAVNEDVRAWVTAYNTHIDYPVAQGEDDLEYVNKDFYGKNTPTGSIYLATENNPGFEDPYNLLYGHHVDNGAMFGDVTNFVEQSYLDSHTKGILVTEKQVYDIEFFATIKTDAYDSTVYNPSNIFDAKDIADYAYSKAVARRGVRNIQKVIALSTCDDYKTNGRTVLFGKLTEHKGAYDPYATIEEGKTPLGGHGDNYWALLNLIALLTTVYLALPIHIIKTKFRRKKKMQERNDSCEFYEVRDFSKMAKLGIMLEILLAIVGILVFILTEDITLPVQMIDCWTPIMLLILVMTLVIDICFLRYRTKDEEEEETE